MICDIFLSPQFQNCILVTSEHPNRSFTIFEQQTYLQYSGEYFHIHVHAHDFTQSWVVIAICSCCSTWSKFCSTWSKFAPRAPPGAICSTFGATSFLNGEAIGAYRCYCYHNKTPDVIYMFLILILRLNCLYKYIQACFAINTIYSVQCEVGTVQGRRVWLQHEAGMFTVRGGHI